MIDIDSYILFVSASILLCIVPGPDMIFLLTRSVAQGKKAGVMAAMGINLGGYFHLFAAILGLSAILATSSLAFSIVKWAGAAYLIYLGVQALCSKGGAISIDTKGVADQSGKTIFWQGFVSDVLNPKVAIFFLALLPQFVDAHADNQISQLILLGLTVNIIAILINITLVCFVDSLTGRLRSSDRIVAWLNKTMGLVFILLGFRLANEKL